MPLASARLRFVFEPRRSRSKKRYWCPAFPGAFLYHPGNRNVPSALRALVDTIQASRAT